MSQSETIARPYAKAAYQHALIDNTIEQWQEFLKVSANFVSSEEVKSRLGASDFFAELQIWLNECLKKMRGKTMQKEESNFLRLLHDNNRLSVLPEVMKQFNLQLYQSKGECEAKVYTAQTLDDKQKDAIAKMLENKLGKKVLLEIIEQPELLAGVRIEYDGFVLDQSTKGRIEQFARKLEDLRN